MWLPWLVVSLHAQQQPAIYYFDSGVVVVKSVYNAKNEVVSRMEYTALEIEQNNGKNTARGKTVKIKNDKETEIIIGNFAYDGSQLLISMGKTAEGKNAWLDYTAGMVPGQNIISHLEFETEAKFLGQMLKICCIISNRKVLSVGEKVTSSLGIWDCVKTGYNMSMKIKSLSISIPADVYVEEWFADDIGIVRTDVYKNGKLYERRLLTTFRNGT